jgi:hypothetical protein
VALSAIRRSAKAAARFAGSFERQSMTGGGGVSPLLVVVRKAKLAETENEGTKPSTC